jgi:hypothetical protein
LENYILITYEDSLVCQTAFKDSALALTQSPVLNGEAKVSCARKRPKETSSKAKTARVPFIDQAKRWLEIPVLYDEYNHNMGAVAERDDMTSRNPRYRPIRRGGHQALEHWLLRVALINSYLLCLLSDVESPRPISFRSQQDFRIQLVDALLHKAPELQISRKRRVAHISTEAENLPSREYEIVKRSTRKGCLCCGELRLGDRPQKRMALGEIVANQRQESNRTCTYWASRRGTLSAGRIVGEEC